MARSYSFGRYDGFVAGSSVAEHVDLEIWGTGHDDIGPWCPIYVAVVVKHFGVIGGEAVNNDRLSPSIQWYCGETSSSNEGGVEGAIEWPRLGGPASVGTFGNENGS